MITIEELKEKAVNKNIFVKKVFEMEISENNFKYYYDIIDIYKITHEYDCILFASPILYGDIIEIEKILDDENTEIVLDFPKSKWVLY